MLNGEQTQILEQAIFLLLRLRDDQSIDNWEVKRARNFNKQTGELNIEVAFKKFFKELKKMSRFQEIFNREWFEQHIRQKPSGVYELRCTLNKVPLSGSGKTIEIAAMNFIKALTASQGKSQKQPNKQKVLFNDFAQKWFKLVKKPMVKPDTYANYYNVFTVHIMPFFKNKMVESLTAMQIQPLILRLEKQKKYTTLRNVKLLLTQIFQSAIGERLITHNPMNEVQSIRHESKKSTALTVTEECAVLESDCCYKLSLILLLFCGMRRGELCSTRIEGNFIVVKDGKIKVGRNQTERKIPITPMLAHYIEGVTSKEFKAAISVTPDVLTRAFKKICPNHHLHELRHTYITRCQECGVPREVVSVWAGHAADKTMTSTVYTHFTEEFMLQEAKKVDYFKRLYNR